MKIPILAILTISFLINISSKSTEKSISAEEFLNGEFENNLGSYCKIIAKNGFITGKYITKPSRGKLIRSEFPLYGVYTEVKDGILVSMNTVFKMEGTDDGLEKISHGIWNGKIYYNQNTFKLNWLLTANKIEEKEWESTNIGVDIFTKK